VKGHLSATIDARMAKARGTAAWEPEGSAAAQIDYDERVFCPIDGESSHDAGRTTAPLRGPSTFATRSMAPNEGHVSWMTVPHGMGPNLLDEGEAAARQSMSTAQGIQALNNMENLVPFGASVDVTGLTGSTWARGVSLQLLQPDVPARKSGSVSWQVRGGDYHDGAAFDIRVVDTVGVTSDQRHTNEDPDNHAVINYLVTWRIGNPDHTVTIKEPEKNRDFVFGEKEAGDIRIEAEAEADPPSYNNRIQPWHIGEAAGSTLEIKKRAGSKEAAGAPVGPDVLIRYKTLPRLYDSFGEKTLTCDNAEPVTVRLFFRKKDKDNPEHKVPNWFYYWKQGPVPGLDQFTEYYESSDTQGNFDHNTGKLAISSLAAEERVPYHITLYSTEKAADPHAASVAIRDNDMTPGKAREQGLIVNVVRIEWPRTVGIETCAAIVLHELLHKEFFDRFRGAPDDPDGDELPTWFEEIAGLRLDPNNPDTHFLRTQGDPEYAAYGDQELLCRLREKLRSPKKALDWASPGSQSKPPEK